MTGKPATYQTAALCLAGFACMMLFAGLHTGLAASAQVEHELVGHEEIADDSLAQVVVARIGDITISGQEFFVSYETGPSFVKRTHRDGPRLAHLDYMLMEKMLAMDGLQQGVIARAGLEGVLREIQLDRAVEEMYREDVLSRVTVDSAALARAVEADEIQVWFQYVQTSTREAAIAIEGQLARGAAFDSLSVTGHNPVNQDAPTFWQIEQQDPVFAQQIASLELNTISPVFETRNGFFLVRIDRVFRPPFVSEMARHEHARKLEKQLRQLVADSLAYAYAAGRMEAAGPVIKRPAFNELFAFFETLPADDSRDVSSALLGNWPGTFTRAGLEGQVDVPLIESSEGAFTVAEFMDWYDLRRFPVEGDSRAQRANKLKAIIWRMFRDRLLGLEAVARGFAERDDVAREVQWWEEKLAYWETREALLAGLSPTEQDIVDLMREYPHRYTHADAEKNRKQAFKDAYTLQERRVLMDYFAQKRASLDIAVDTLALKQLPLHADVGAKPIEMVAFKKEGTFPRVAYPTIDRVWERY